MVKKISIILPIYNESTNIVIVYEQILHELTCLHDFLYEIIFVDDGSTDNSSLIINDLVQKNKHVKNIFFTRNFGHQIALTAGYDNATGDAIITMDADLQDPPILIPKMIHCWQNGADIVYARRKNRDDTLTKRVTAQLFYKFLSRVAGVAIPRHVGDFRLIDKKVLIQLRLCKEKYRYLRGLVAWTGFTHVFVDFDRPARLTGESGYSWKKMFELAFDALIGFSFLPLRMSMYAGLLTILASVSSFFYLMINSLFYKISYDANIWFLIIGLLLLGIQFIVLWLLGEYIGRIYDQQNNRPLYIVKESTFDK